MRERTGRAEDIARGVPRPPQWRPGLAVLNLPSAWLAVWFDNLIDRAALAPGGVLAAARLSA